MIEIKRFKGYINIISMFHNAVPNVFSFDICYESQDHRIIVVNRYNQLVMIATNKGLNVRFECDQLFYG